MAEIFSDEWLESYIKHGLELWSKMRAHGGKPELTPEEIAKFRETATFNNGIRRHCSYSTLAALLEVGLSGKQDYFNDNE